MNSLNVWIKAALLGLVGIAISAAIFFGMMIATERVFGIAAIFTGALAGGMAAIGYKIGGGVLTKKSEVSNLLNFATIIGLLAVAAGFVIAPYLYFAADKLDFFTFWSLYSEVGGFGFIDVIFVAIGAYGGRWAAKKVGYTMITETAEAKAIEKVKKEDIASIDKKLK